MLPMEYVLVFAADFGVAGLWLAVLGGLCMALVAFLFVFVKTIRFEDVINESQQLNTELTLLHPDGLDEKQ